MAWTDERVKLLKKYWGEGLSANQIAVRLGGVTRNAVIGKVHRLGLSGRTERKQPRSRKRNKPSTKRGPKTSRGKLRMFNGSNFPLSTLYGDAVPYSEPAEEFNIPLTERKALAELTENNCRWPIGDPQSGEFHFCNRNKVAGLPYCETHARRAFQPPQIRRRTHIRDRRTLKKVLEAHL